jgi:hypothetical protein
MLASEIEMNLFFEELVSSRAKPAAQAQWIANHKKLASFVSKEVLCPERADVVQKRGYIYFFRAAGSVNGSWLYKYGRTCCWARRKKEYVGPSTPAVVFFVRIVEDAVRSEYRLGAFLRAHGYCRTEFGNEWLQVASEAN